MIDHCPDELKKELDPINAPEESDKMPFSTSHSLLALTATMYIPFSVHCFAYLSLDSFQATLFVKRCILTACLFFYLFRFVHHGLDYQNTMKEALLRLLPSSPLYAAVRDGIISPTSPGITVSGTCR